MDEQTKRILAMQIKDQKELDNIIKLFDKFLKRGEELKQKREQDLEKILKENNWKNMTPKKIGRNQSIIYTVIKQDNTIIEIQGYYCNKCGYVIGTPREQRINNIGFLSTRIGKGYYCSCGELIGEHIDLIG